MEHVDVLIVGAGLSGSARLPPQDELPGQDLAILEARETIGGTWDLFRYPGIRSDSDMYTLGYSFRPWTEAEGDRRRPVDPRLHPRDGARVRRRRARSASSTRSSRARRGRATTRAGPSTVERSDTGERSQSPATSCSRCAGYYRYDEGYTPDFAGTERLPRPVVHPQHWPDDLDYAGKRVVVIGSGATAVTLVPAMADTRRARDDAAALADLHRVAAGEDPLAGAAARKFLPRRLAYAIMRWKNVLLTMLSYQLSRAPAARDEGADPQGPREAAAGRLRHRHALQAAVQPVGPAHVPGPGRRPVRGDQRRQRVDRHRPDRHASPRTGIRLASGAGADGRHRRHRDRAQHARRSAASSSRSTASRSSSPRPSATRA